jgi:hypothetical protein
MLRFRSRSGLVPIGFVLVSESRHFSSNFIFQIERKAGQVTQDGMFQVVLRISAWTCLALIAFVTLGPVGLRPESGMPPHFERFAAFAIAGTLFAAAYPRHILFAAVIVVGAAVVFELLQLLAPSRHGRLFDAGVKVAGGFIGLGAGWIAARWSARRQQCSS